MKYKIYKTTDAKIKRTYNKQHVVLMIKRARTLENFVRIVTVQDSYDYLFFFSRLKNRGRKKSLRDVFVAYIILYITKWFYCSMHFKNIQRRVSKISSSILFVPRKILSFSTFYSLINP